MFSFTGCIEKVTVRALSSLLLSSSHELVLLAKRSVVDVCVRVNTLCLSLSQILTHPHIHIHAHMHGQVLAHTLSHAHTYLSWSSQFIPSPCVPFKSVCCGVQRILPYGVAYPPALPFLDSAVWCRSVWSAHDPLLQHSVRL